MILLAASKMLSWETCDRSNRPSCPGVIVDSWQYILTSLFSRGISMMLPNLALRIAQRDRISAAEDQLDLQARLLVAGLHIRKSVTGIISK